MKRSIQLILILFLVFSCETQDSQLKKTTGKRIILNPYYDNVAKLNDTLIISESTFRNCEYEELTDLKIEDSLNLIKLGEIVSTEHKSPNRKRTTIGKDLLLVPVEKGITTIKLYRFYKQEVFARDTGFYTITIQDEHYE
jgi:hypothetical protein